MQKELPRLRAQGAWEPGHCSKWVSRMFLVPKGPGEWRIIIDLRGINDFCRRRYGVRTALRDPAQAAQHGGTHGLHVLNMDLADGFYALGIAPEFRDFFTFRFNGELWRLTGLPMGWSLSPYYLCTLMDVWVRHMRGAHAGKVPARPTARSRKRRMGGARVLPYVDDFLFIAHSLAAALRLRARVEALLTALGMSRNPDKGEWEPTQNLVHLGLRVDLQAGKFFAPEEKLASIAALAKSMMGRAARNRRWLPVKELAALAGKAQFLYLAIPVARYYLREMHDVVATAHSWSAQVKVTNQLQRDLRWWMRVPEERNGADMFTSRMTAVLHTDSSQYGWGGVLNEELEARGFWYGTDREKHITWKELKAVRLSVESFLPLLRGGRVLLHEDNQAVVGVLSNLTSRSPAMMSELRKLWYLLDNNDIWLQPRYIRSAANVWADRLSRELDTDDWLLHPSLFKMLAARWGRPTMDCFASADNRQVERFYARWRCPSAWGVDSLQQPDAAWRQEYNWCNPPWSLLMQVACKLRHSGAAAIVIAPFWPEQPWWPLLEGLATEVQFFAPSPDLFWSGCCGSRSAIGSPRWGVVAFRVPARLPQPSPFRDGCSA